MVPETRRVVVRIAAGAFPGSACYHTAVIVSTLGRMQTEILNLM
jgi:hypothetical protein